MAPHLISSPPSAQPYIPCQCARGYSQTVRVSPAQRRRRRSHCSPSCTLVPRPASNRTHFASCPGSPPGSFTSSALAAPLPLWPPTYSPPPPRARPFIPCQLAREYSKIVRASPAQSRRRHPHCSLPLTPFCRLASKLTHAATFAEGPHPLLELHARSIGRVTPPSPPSCTPPPGYRGAVPRDTQTRYRVTPWCCTT